MQNYQGLIDKMEQFFHKHSFPKLDVEQKMKVYVIPSHSKTSKMPDNTKVTEGCLNWLYLQAGKLNPWDLHSLPQAMYALTVHIVRNLATKEQKTEEEVKRSLVNKKKKRSSTHHGGSMKTTNPSSSGYLRSDEGVTTTVSYVGDRTGIDTDDLFDEFDTSYDEGEGEGGAYQNPMPNNVKTSTTIFRYKTTRSTDDEKDNNKGDVPPSDDDSISNSTDRFWLEMKSGCFRDQNQVEGHLLGWDFIYRAGLSCPFHRDFENDEAMKECALNILNRMAYNMLDVLIFAMNIEPVIPGRHTPYPDDSMEIQVRDGVLKGWGIPMVEGVDDLKFDEEEEDGSPPPPPGYKRYLELLNKLTKIGLV